MNPAQILQSLPEQQTVQVLLVEDQALVRASLVSLLNSTCLFQALAVESVREALQQMTQASQPDLILCDYYLRQETAEELLLHRHQWPEVPVVLLTSHCHAEAVQRCRTLGARGFLFKESPAEAFVEALTAIHEGQEHYQLPMSDAHVAEERADQPDLKLTETEFEILRWLATGMSNKQIAVSCGRSAETVKTHIGSILKKLRCRTRTQVVMKARYYHLI